MPTINISRCTIFFLFTTESSSKYVLFVLLFASVCLVVVESRNETALDPLKAGFSVIARPIQSIAEAPYFVTDLLVELFASRHTMQEKNSDLEAEIRELTYSSQRLAAIEAENIRDKGKSDGVRVRQAVIDAEGLFGQIIATGQSNARVLMVSDPRHAIPIEIVRSGFRSIAVGTGLSDRLDLENVSTTADLIKGDLLVSSGLGGRFPRGYPVGEIQSVDVDPARNYADVYASIQARLDTSRHVLILFEGTTP